MGIYLKLVNYSALINELKTEPIILNDLNSITEEDRTYIENITVNKFIKKDVFSVEPTCACSEITGAYNLGVLCTKCRTTVTEPLSEDLTPKVWFRSPKGVAPLINPSIWIMLSNQFNKGDKNDPILRKLLLTQSDCIFSNYLPLINKALIIQEDTEVGNFADPLLMNVRDAINTIKSIDTPLIVLSQRQKENRTVKTFSKLAEYYNTAFKVFFATKLGLIRKHLYSTRPHFVCRAVISSNTKKHRYDCIQLPWTTAVTLLAVHLKSKLLKRGYTTNEIMYLLQKYTVVYSPLIDSLFDELFAEAKDNCFYVIMVRPPSLVRGNTQSLKFNGVKKDPNDITISLSILDVRAFNADFDGDAMAVALLLDNKLSRESEGLAPYKNMYDPNSPRKLNDVSAIPKPVITNIIIWLHSHRELSNDPKKINFLKQLAIS